MASEESGVVVVVNLGFAVRTAEVHGRAVRVVEPSRQPPTASETLHASGEFNPGSRGRGSGLYVWRRLFPSRSFSFRPFTCLCVEAAATSHRVKPSLACYARWPEKARNQVPMACLRGPDVRRRKHRQRETHTQRERKKERSRMI